MLFSRETIQKHIIPFCGLIALLIFTASCGSDSKNSGTPTGPGETTTLFQDDFSGAFLSSAWTPHYAAGSTVGIDASWGQPAPSLHINSDSGVARVTLTQPYSNAGGLSFSVMVKIDNSGRAGGNTTGIDISIISQAGSREAWVNIHRSIDGSDNVNILYTIGASQLSREINIGLSPGFHEFRFTMFADGTSKLFRDGVQVLSGTSPQTLYQLILEPVSAEAHFDNVVVSR